MTTPTTIRALDPAQDNDVVRFRELRLLGLQDTPEAFGASWAEERAENHDFFRERLSLDHGRFVLGAFQEDALVAVVGMFRRPSAKVRHRGNIWGMYVHPDARRQGLGRAILEAAIERARHIDGLELLALGVGSDNRAATRLYEDVGFQSAGIEPRGLKVEGRYVDEHRMVLMFEGMS
ncbi:MAG: GNAT family N-acetyltransferase [Myxococcota bacterium]